jgi:cytochrome c553
MVLGFVGDEPVLPSAKFLMGLTCRSCHVPGTATTTATTSGKALTAVARRGQAAACAACHDKEFGRVLGWWINGAKAREQNVAAYVTSAQQTLKGAPDSSRSLLRHAQEMLTLVRAAGGQHNIELSDLIFRSSIANATSAYRIAGKAAPAPPELGNTPHVGTCSFCHYSGDERWDYKNVPAGIHERLLKTTQ